MKEDLVGMDDIESFILEFVQLEDIALDEADILDTGLCGTFAGLLQPRLGRSSATKPLGRCCIAL